MSSIDFGWGGGADGAGRDGGYRERRRRGGRDRFRDRGRDRERDGYDRARNPSRVITMPKPLATKGNRNAYGQGAGDSLRGGGSRRRRGGRRGGKYREDDAPEVMAGGERGRGRGRKPKFKRKDLTVEELDAQMDDYFNRESKAEGDESKDSAGQSRGGSKKRAKPDAEKLDSAMESYWSKSAQAEGSSNNGKAKTTGTGDDEEDGAV